MPLLAVHHLGDAAGQSQSRQGQAEPLDVNRAQSDWVPQFLDGAGVLGYRGQRLPNAAARAVGAGQFDFVTGIPGFILDIWQPQVQTLTNDSGFEPSEQEGLEDSETGAAAGARGPPREPWRVGCHGMPFSWRAGKASGAGGRWRKDGEMMEK